LISAVIPAYNEEIVLEATVLSIANILSELSPKDWEIVLVDDGSLDNTAQVAERLARDTRIRYMRHEQNRGKGAALRTGVFSTQGDAVLLCDADLSTPPQMLKSFLPELANGADIIIGDRKSPESRIEQPQSLLRRVMGVGYAALARQVAGISLRDYNCGFKLLRGQAARDLFSECRSDRWTWDVEIIALAVRRGLTIRALPVTWRQGERSSVSPFRDAVKSFVDLARLWMRLRRK